VRGRYVGDGRRTRTVPIEMNRQAPRAALIRQVGVQSKQRFAKQIKRARLILGDLEVGTALARRHGDVPDVGTAGFPLEHDNGTLGEEAALGALGLVEIKLTDAEEAILAQPVPVTAVLIKPTGQPYLSHPSYTQWFNRAFGRLGWAIVPKAKPRMADKTISCPYILYIHGKPAAFALGEQEYHESNKEQTYGDAYEATVASALRRCAKRLGVGLELWDRTWLQTFIDQHCVKVWCGDDPKPKWRRRQDPPFWNEKTAAGRKEQSTVRHEANDDDQRREQRRPPSAGHDGRGDELITQAHVDAAGVKKLGQVERLGIILRNSGRDVMQFKMWLVRNYNIDSRKLIKRRDYDAICAAIEAPGELPERSDPFPAVREPGQEG
jgi:hypothetical protein